MARSSSADDRNQDQLIDDLRASVRPLRSPADLDPLIDAIADARIVQLGEATHGTSEFYRWRTEISQRLITEHGFTFIAVEGDWPACARVDRYIRGRSDRSASAEEVLMGFERWPSWMWGNREVAALTEWLRSYNRDRPDPQQAGFYGLDVYSLLDSMNAVVSYLEQIDPQAARTARRAYSCFDPYHDDVQDYARATALVPTSCEAEAVAMLRALQTEAPRYAEDGRDAFFEAEQNALVARNAERYYRSMIRGGPTAWNVRDHHMMETLDRLLDHHGPNSRAIVWAHNTHVGDARFTPMTRSGMINLGQLAREAHGDGAHDGDGVALVGFGTYQGTVIAGDEWGEPMQRMTMPPARPGSWEAMLHEAASADGLLLFDGADDGGIPGLDTPVDHRAVGVVYDPRGERWGNYVPTIVGRRYDAFIHVESSTAVTPLRGSGRTDSEVADTYPSGV